MRIIPSHGVCGHTDKRIFRLRSALRVLMHRRRVAAMVVQLIAGRLSFGAIASRGALSFLDSVFQFVAKHWMSCRIPWDPLKCELRAHASLVLLIGDWTTRWCPEVCCSNASEKKVKGWSFATCTAPHSLVARSPDVLERSRFRRPVGSERAREHAFQQRELADWVPEEEFHEMEYEV